MITMSMLVIEFLQRAQEHDAALLSYGSRAAVPWSFPLSGAIVARRAAMKAASSAESAENGVGPLSSRSRIRRGRSPHRRGHTDGYSHVRRYAPCCPDILTFKCTPAAQSVLDACETLRHMYQNNARTIPKDAPTAFIKPRWAPHVLTDADADRRFYEICALSELKNALRAGDIWVVASRQFKAFDERPSSSELVRSKSQAQLS